MKTLDEWTKYLEKNLSFPFDAVVAENQQYGPLDNGNKVKVHRISTEDDLFGIIVKVRFGRKKYHFPLNELKALDKESSNYKLLKDYTRWSPEDEL